MKIILCRPEGGLNDMLCQIEKCCRYAEKTGRHVIVDTNYKNTISFHDDLGKYFSSQQEGLILGLDNIVESYWDNSTFPHQMLQRLFNYEIGRTKVTTRNGSRKFFCDEEGTILSFDFGKNYQEDILLHHQAGGGQDSLTCLLRVKLQKDILETLLERLGMVGRPYSALHIRNTDYVTNYQENVVRFLSSTKGSCFLAKDSQEVLDFAESLEPSRKLFNFCDALSKTGEPIQHMKIEQEDAYHRNKDAIVDLLMLGMANKLECGIVENHWGGKRNYSGFSRLAMMLNTNRPILMRLIEAQNYQAIFPLWGLKK